MKPDRKPKQPIIKAISLKPDRQLQRKNFLYNKRWQKPARHRGETRQNCRADAEGRTDLQIRK